MTESDKAAFREIREALKGLQFTFLGLPKIPELLILERYFEESADLQIKMFKAALKVSQVVSRSNINSGFTPHTICN